MGLLSFLKRQPNAPSEPADPAEVVQQARTNARRRLMGAVVLLGIGVIGFPLLFETQPRPIPVDLPIEIPRKEGSPPLDVPAARPQARVEPPAPEVVTERAEDAGREVKPTAAETPRTSAPSHAATPAPAVTAPRERPAVPAESARPTAPPPAAEDAQRARALLEGRGAEQARASEPAAGRFVVQVGAFTEANAVREARAKVEKLGLKTYTQVVETEGGKRTRVRVGPFTSRADADKASARIKSAGLSAAVLTL